MEDIVKTISALKGVGYKKETSSWFNGHGYFPLHVYEIFYTQKDWKFQVTGEWRVSDFVRSNENAGYPFSSVYLWTVKAVKLGVQENYQFEVLRTSWIRSLMYGAGFSIRTESENLRQQIKEMGRLADWYFNKPYPLDNIFNCETEKNITTIFTAFNTEFNSSKKILSAIDIIEHFCWKIDDLEMNKLHTTIP